VPILASIQPARDKEERTLRGKKTFEDIQAISLDAMGTIIFLKKSAQAVYGEILRDLGFDPQRIVPLTRDPGLFRRYWKEAESRLPPAFLRGHVDRFAHYQETPYAFWGLIFRVMFEDLKLPMENLRGTVETAYHRFAAPDLWAVESTLKELAEFCTRRKVKLLVTSNWDFRLPKILKDLGIEPIFRQIITSALVGYEKPSEKIFHYLASAAGCAPAQILHVGDRVEDDVLGAERAGLRAALYSKDCDPEEDKFAFACVQRLNQIPALLKVASRES
jgi:putative hydrolase of the HAD superfamily